MDVVKPRRVRALTLAVSTALVSSLVVLVGGASSASAATGPGPIADVAATGASADALPTVQIDGVVWSQAIVGNTVYAGRQFTNARPAGSAPGTNLTPRSNLFSYDITTGVLNPTFAPTLNGSSRRWPRRPTAPGSTSAALHHRRRA